MIGNVAEFVADFYEPFGEASVTDPRGPEKGDLRIVRGGSWAAKPGQLRTSLRERVKPEIRGNYIGFRCVLDLAGR